MDALKAGIQEQLDKPFWGIIVPNPENPPEVTPPAAVQAAAAAPLVSDTVAAPVIPESVVESAESDSASTAEISAAVADVAPPAQIAVTADDPTPPARAGSHRGRDSGDAGAAEGSNATDSSGRHRAAS